MRHQSVAILAQDFLLKQAFNTAIFCRAIGMVRRSQSRSGLLPVAGLGCLVAALSIRSLAHAAATAFSAGWRTTLRGAPRGSRAGTQAKKDLGEFDFGEYDIGSSTGVLEADEETIELSAPEAEVFARRKTGRWECDNCGFTYNPNDGFGAIPPGTPFQDLPATFRCPQCMVSKDRFEEEFEEIAGFAENQGYGLGFNTMTSGQKNLVIWGGLGLAFLTFLGVYFVD
mmetsp:Transcript_7601/g.10708  ORF Transcript_7601/g.10708 Transcript_7601/m.10708 type:complete len:227 (+) Transcript_7601:3-683(+)